MARAAQHLLNDKHNSGKPDWRHNANSDEYDRGGHSICNKHNVRDICDGHHGYRCHQHKLIRRYGSPINSEQRHLSTRTLHLDLTTPKLRQFCDRESDFVFWGDGIRNNDSDGQPCPFLVAKSHLLHIQPGCCDPELLWRVRHGIDRWRPHADS